MANINIFVANLNFKTTEEDLLDLFGEYGEVEKVKIVTDRDSGRSKGFGFVEMANEEDGLAAIEDLNEAEFDEREIVVKKARPKENNRGGGGGGYRGGRNNRGGGGYGGGGYGGGGRNNRGGGGYGGGGYGGGGRY